MFQSNGPQYFSHPTRFASTRLTENLPLLDGGQTGRLQTQLRYHGEILPEPNPALSDRSCTVKPEDL